MIDKLNILVFWHSGKSNGVLIVTGRLKGGDIGFVGDAGTTVGNSRVFGHDNLLSFVLGIVGKLTIIISVGKVGGGADAGSDLGAIDANGVETKTVSVNIGPNF